MNPNPSQNSGPPSTWYLLSPERVLEELASSLRGLTEAEAYRRLKVFGPNEIQEIKKIRPFKILLRQFTGIIVGVLVGAGVLSGFLGEWTDAVAIFSIVLLNGLIGFFQEFKAEKAMAALKKMTAPQARVRRGGQARKIPARQVVPGDLLELEAGDRVSADARLIQVAAMKCVESALTGESEPVPKAADPLEKAHLPLGDQTNMAFMGTSVSAGVGQAVVVATGMATEFGKIAGLLQSVGEEGPTPLQRQLQSVGRLLVWACLGLVALIFLLGWWRRLPALDFFLTSVSLAVAAVPEGLPTVVTIALALGVQRMARRRALVRRLSAVETLGSTNVICTDKTGTLTVGEMTVRRIEVGGEIFSVSGEGYHPSGQVYFQQGSVSEKQRENIRLLLTLLVGCNGARLFEEKGRWEVLGDPTEGALITAGLKMGVAQEAVETQFPKVREFPFDSERKRMSVVRKLPSGEWRSFVKGAPDLLLERCTHLLAIEGIRPLTDQDRREIGRQVEAMAKEALRVLAAAYRDFPRDDPKSDGMAEAERELVFAGFVGMQDPPRPEVQGAISRCQSAGIRVVMITGDHPHTGKAIARELGIAREEDSVVSGAELDGWSEAELQKRVAEIRVYARVGAEHKLRIVRAWRAVGGVIAMTGDGVNDAPAIKGADIGIAMGRTGTEVTKEASDMVITDDNFASIIAAVEEGRGIYDNIRKTLQYLLAGNVGELLLMVVAVMAGLPVPLLPIHLLWINLVTDGLPALVLATDPIDPDVMNRAPRKKGEKMTDRGFFLRIGITGLLTAGAALAGYFYGLRFEKVEIARTHAFAVLVYAELLRSFGARSETKPIWRMGLFSNIRLALFVGVMLVIQPWSHHSQVLMDFFQTAPLGIGECLVMLAIGAIPLAVLEVGKIFPRKTKSLGIRLN